MRRTSHQLAQDVIDKAGYGGAFGTDWETAVGLAVHEDPYLGQSGSGT